MPRLETRTSLLTIAFIGLSLDRVPGVFSLSGVWKTAFVLVGGVFFGYSFFKLATKTVKAEDSTNEHTAGSNIAIVSAIVGVASLLLDRLMHLHSWLHALVSLVGWLSFLFCLSMPTSRWKYFAWIGIYLNCISSIHWKDFSIFATIFATMPPLLLVLIFISWLIVSALVYLALSRRKPSSSNAELH